MQLWGKARRMMDEMIFKKAAIDALSTPHGILYPIRTIKSLPSVQSEIIRCKDCVNHCYHEGIPYCMAIDYGYGWKDDDF